MVATFPVLQLASGDALSIQVYQFSGARPGKKVYLQANLHGAELSGNAVIYQLIEFLKTLEPTALAGEIWLVPLCNPLAVNQRTHHLATGRFNPYDGKDWNRIFWDNYEQYFDLGAFARSQLGLSVETIQHHYQQLLRSSFQAFARQAMTQSASRRFACLLQSLCLDADYLIDLHSSANQGLDYLYCFRRRQAAAHHFLLDYGLLFDQYEGGAFDEAFLKPWLALEDRLGELSQQAIQFEIEAWTLELGSALQMSPSSVAKGVRGIQSYLAHKGVLNIPAPTPRSTMRFVPLSQIQLYYAPHGGIVQARLELGAAVQAGQRLYQLLSFSKHNPSPLLSDIYAENSGLVFDVSINHSVNEGELVLKVLPDASPRAD